MLPILKWANIWNIPPIIEPENKQSLLHQGKRFKLYNIIYIILLKFKYGYFIGWREWGELPASKLNKPVYYTVCNPKYNVFKT